MQRFIQNLLPCSFNDTWVKNAIRNIGKNEIQLRNRYQLQNFYSNLARLDSFPLFSFPKIWESFPLEQIKIICKITDFDAKLKTFFLNDLSPVAVCNRLLCLACMAVLICFSKQNIVLSLFLLVLHPLPPIFIFIFIPILNLFCRDVLRSSLVCSCPLPLV